MGKILEIGKVPVETLNRLVLDPINKNINKRKDIVVRPSTGEDCSAVDPGGEICVFSTDPITAAGSNAGYLAVHINCNDAASAGAEPVGILLTILLPAGSDEDGLKDIIDGAYKAAGELGIEILGGHTEVTEAVNKTVVNGTVVAKTRNRKFISSGGAKIGQDIIMSKWAAIEGTSIIARDHEEKLIKSLDGGIINEAKELSSKISVVREGIIGSELGATAMHDATEGGILGAVLGGRRNVPASEPRYTPTIYLCLSVRKKYAALAGINYLRLISSGTLVVDVTAFEGERLVGALKEEEGNAAVIGKITERGKYRNHRPRKENS